MTEKQTERVADASRLLSSAFLEDPVIIYMLSSMKPDARVAYFPRYFHALLTAAAMNKAIFHEADDWKVCGVLMPPGRRVDNPMTIMQAGFLPVLWNIGLKGCQVNFIRLPRTFFQNLTVCAANVGRIPASF